MQLNLLTNTSARYSKWLWMESYLAQLVFAITPLVHIGFQNSKQIWIAWMSVNFLEMSPKKIWSRVRMLRMYLEKGNFRSRANRLLSNLDIENAKKFFEFFCQIFRKNIFFSLDFSKKNFFQKLPTFWVLNLKIFYVKVAQKSICATSKITFF